tara:strand:- start:2090 stop:2761 length:672 start_codon:yes stop_codon:yes gene_type:complete
MHQSVKNIVDLYDNVKQKIQELNYENYDPNIIAVSKTFKMEDIKPLIDYGHKHFGENKVQEALGKWEEAKAIKKDLKLHMIGKLQTNKVKQAVTLFDYIHSVDNLKLAKKISEEQKKQNKRLKIFLQVNIGEEDQKSGIKIEYLDELVNDSKNLNLDIIGLMCLPPINESTSKYFSLIKKKNDELNFKELSLGMSNDYIDALNYKTTFIRIGTKIFGERSKLF